MNATFIFTHRTAAISFERHLLCQIVRCTSAATLLNGEVIDFRVFVSMEELAEDNRPPTSLTLAIGWLVERQTPFTLAFG